MKKSKFRVTEEKIKELVLTESKNLQFPSILQTLRKIHGLTRKTVCKDLNISPMRLFWLEHGHFKRPISKEELQKIAFYYGVSLYFLGSKLNEFEKASFFRFKTEYKTKRENKEECNNVAL